LVPHEPNETNINYIKNKFINNILITELKMSEKKEKIDLEKVIIVNTIGDLLKLYGIADVAYIGGGFGTGVHSITEPSGYGIPIICGPNCYNSPFSDNLIKKNVLLVVNNGEKLYE